MKTLLRGLKGKFHAFVDAHVGPTSSDQPQISDSTRRRMNSSRKISC